MCWSILSCFWSHKSIKMNMHQASVNTIYYNIDYITVSYYYFSVFPFCSDWYFVYQLNCTIKFVTSHTCCIHCEEIWFFLYYLTQQFWNACVKNNRKISNAQMFARTYVAYVCVCEWSCARVGMCCTQRDPGQHLLLWGDGALAATCYNR